MPDLVPFHIDLAEWEQQRLAAVLAGAGDQLDLVGMYWDECDAHRLLYAGLSPEQWKVYDQLVEAGVLGS